MAVFHGGKLRDCSLHAGDRICSTFCIENAGGPASVRCQWRGTGCPANLEINIKRLCVLQSAVTRIDRNAPGAQSGAILVGSMGTNTRRLFGSGRRPNAGRRARRAPIGHPTIRSPRNFTLRPTHRGPAGILGGREVVIAGLVVIPNLVGKTADLCHRCM